MKDTFKIVGWSVLVLVILFGLTWGGIAWYRFFEPKREDARREVFENTRSYNQAKLQELSKIRLEYIKADDDEKAALKSVIQHRYAEYDPKRLPDHLANFLKEIMEIK